jgi:hypothetical protein
LFAFPAFPNRFPAPPGVEVPPNRPPVLGAELVWPPNRLPLDAVVFGLLPPPKLKVLLAPVLDVPGVELPNGFEVVLLPVLLPVLPNKLDEPPEPPPNMLPPVEPCVVGRFVDD